MIDEKILDLLRKANEYVEQSAHLFDDVKKLNEEIKEALNDHNKKEI